MIGSIIDFKSFEIKNRIKEYAPVLKSAGTALLKIGMVGAACYGAYKWIFGDVVHINDFMTQAKNDFYKDPLQTVVPSSVARLTDSFYNEQRNFAKWPKSGREFFAEHLASDAPMSSAIVTYLLEKAASLNDFSFQRFAIKTCKSADPSPAGCLAAVDFFTASENPDRLSNAMSITSQCRKSGNAFCKKTLRRAEEESLAQASESDVQTLMRTIARKKIAKDHTGFIQKAIAASKEVSEKQEQGIEDCRRYLFAAQEEEDWKACFSHAGFIDKLEALDRGAPVWWKQSYSKRKLKELEKDHSEWLVDQGNGFSAVCSQVPDFAPCREYSKTLVQKYFENGLSTEAMKLLKANGAAGLEDEIGEVLHMNAVDGKWNKGVQFILSFLKAHPDSGIRGHVDRFWRDLLLSNEAYEAVDLLSLNNPIEVEWTLKKALESSNSQNLMKVFKLAKTWIDANDRKHDAHLIFIIEKLFSKGDSYSYYYSNSNKRLCEQMAQVLATKWMQIKDPENPALRDLWQSYEISYHDVLSYDRYSYSVNSVNWKQKLRIKTDY